MRVRRVGMGVARDELVVVFAFDARPRERVARDAVADRDASNPSSSSAWVSSSLSSASGELTGRSAPRPQMNQFGGATFSLLL